MRKFLFICLLSLILLPEIYSETTQFSLELIAKFDADLNKYGQIGFSPNGKYFFALGYKKNLQVWETETQKLLYTINGKFGYGAKFSPDGKRLSAFTDKDGLILETETGKILLKLNSYKEKIRFLNWSPNSQSFAIGTENFAVDIWNSETGKTEQNFKIHEKKKGFWNTDSSQLIFVSAEFSPDGKKLLTNCNDQETEYWDLKNGKLIYEFRNSYNAIDKSKFSPDGKWILTASSEEFCLWNAKTNSLIRSFIGLMYPSFSPDSHYLGLVNDSVGSVPNKLFDLTDQKSFLSLQQDDKHYGMITVWSPDGKSFVTSNGQGIIWNLETGKFVNIFNRRYSFEILGGYSPADHDSYHPNSKILMVQSDKELKFFNTMRYEQLPLLPKAKSPATWSPSGKYLLAQVKGERKIALLKIIEK